MKFERPLGFRTLPLDGVVRLGPGERMALADGMLPDPPVEKWRETMKAIRGEILGATFEVDNSLVLIWLADRFSTIDPAYGGVELLESETRFRKNTLGQKFSAVREIIRRELPDDEAQELPGDLQELVVVRNLLAHQPCWIHPIWDPARDLTTAFCAYIANETHIWSVDDVQYKEWGALVQRCYRIAQIPPLIASKREVPSTKHDLGGFPVGVIFPPDDPLGRKNPINAIAQTNVTVIIQSDDG
jgi:hypothetical protein